MDHESKYEFDGLEMDIAFLKSEIQKLMDDFCSSKLQLSSDCDIAGNLLFKWNILIFQPNWIWSDFEYHHENDYTLDIHVYTDQDEYTPNQTIKQGKIERGELINASPIILRNINMKQVVPIDANLHKRFSYFLDEYYRFYDYCSDEGIVDKYFPYPQKNNKIEWSKETILNKVLSLFAIKV